MRRITSRQNVLVSQYREAARGAVPDVMLLDGAHLIGEALDAGIRMQHLMVAAEAVEKPEIADLLSRDDVARLDVAIATAPVMDAVSPVRSSSPVVALASRPAASPSVFGGRDALAIVVCDVQDPGNLGAIVRVAEAAGASGVVAAGQCADPFGWKALRGSMGSALRLPIASAVPVSNAVDDARRNGARIIATVPRSGVPLFDAPLTGAIALLIGGEGLGLPDDVVRGADVRVTIPMQPPVESLNAAVAAAVLLYEVRRQRSLDSRFASQKSNVLSSDL